MALLVDNELSAKIIAKAWLEPEFKAKLIADPVKTLREMGAVIPDGMAFEVKEAEVIGTYPPYTLILPPPPAGIDLKAIDVVASASAVCSGTWHNLCGCG